jgi:hypothetical protein
VPDFDPNDNVTKGQLIVIAVRLAERFAPNATPNTGTPTFPDVRSDHPFRNEIGIAEQLGFIQGNSANNLVPDSDASRGNTFVILNRLVDFLVEQGVIPPLGSSNAGIITAVDPGNNQYRFTNGAGLSILVTYDTNADTFSVDGQAATLEVFETNATVGDEVTFVNDPSTAASDADQHQLRNVSPANRRSGVIGNVNTAADTFAIVDPTSGVVIGGPFTYTGDILQLDGAAVTIGQFENNINEGDTMAGTTSGANETWNLTNATRTGSATNVAPGASPVIAFQIGNLGDVATDANDTEYIAGDGAAGTETFTVGGSAATAVNFFNQLDPGDTVAYSRAGGVETFALTNVAPAAITGIAAGGDGQDIDTAGNSLTIITGATEQVVDYDDATSFTVNGTLVTEAQFEANLTSGDSVTFTPDNPDTAANEEKIALTNTTLTGQVGDIDVANTTYDVVNPEGNVIFNDLDYTAAIFGGTDGDRYFVNNTERTIDVFEDFLIEVTEETNPNSTDTIEVVDNGALSTDHKLTTDEALD